MYHARSNKKFRHGAFKHWGWGLILILSVISNIVLAEACRTTGISSRTEVMSAINCLEHNLDKSKELVKRHRGFNETLVHELERYVRTRAKLKRFRLLQQYGKSWFLGFDQAYYDLRIPRLEKTLNASRQELRRLESRSAVLDELFVKFERQIGQLADEIELLKLEHAKIIDFKN